jgi:hypothetical protein
MTCSLKLEELLDRPVRMAFIDYEAKLAVRSGDGLVANRWPSGSLEFKLWNETYWATKENPPAAADDRGASIPHQRDAEMATTSTAAILT